MEIAEKVVTVMVPSVYLILVQGLVTMVLIAGKDVDVIMVNVCLVLL
jgi:hypothetical protein